MVEPGIEPGTSLLVGRNLSRLVTNQPLHLDNKPKRPAQGHVQPTAYPNVAQHNNKSWYPSCTFIKSSLFLSISDHKM
jgi:hypothetical protein